MPITLSSLTLYNCSLDRTMHKTIDFASKSARDTFFSSSNAIANIYSTPYSADAYFIREGQSVKVGINSDVLDQNGVNYCRFINPEAGASQYIYSFIDDIRYIAPNVSELKLRTDVMLTNCGDFSAQDCFVERQHIKSSDDTWAVDPIYFHTAEPLDTGDIFTWAEIRLTENLSARDKTEFGTNYYVCVALTDVPTDIGYPTIPIYFGGLPNAIYYLVFDYTDIYAFFSKLDSDGMADAVISVFPIPKNYVTLRTPSITYGTATVNFIDDKTYSSATNVTVLMGTTLQNGYTPRNKKLLCYPYNYLTLHNMQGSAVDLKFENSGNATGDIDFKALFAPGTNSSLTVIPQKYNNQYVNTWAASYYTEYLGNYDYAVEYNNFPEIPYKTDIYKNYIARNKNSLESQQFSQLYNAYAPMLASQSVSPVTEAGKDAPSAGATGTAAGVNAALGLATSTMGYIKSKTDYQNTMTDLQNRPNIVKGRPSGNVDFKSGATGIYAARKCIRLKRAKQIDAYFDMYGYNISEVTTPNWTNRAHYNFIKTVDINITGTIPKNDKAVIEALFNSGCTIWHMSGGATYGVYDTSNV